MNDNLEERVKKILSMRRKLEAQLLFYQIDADYKQKDFICKIKRLLNLSVR